MASPSTETIFNIETLEGLTIPLTKKHYTKIKDGLNPLGESVREHINPKLYVFINTLAEQVHVWQEGIAEEIGVIMTGGTFDDWVSLYYESKIEGYFEFYKQDPEEDDERLWIKFREK